MKRIHLAALVLLIVVGVGAGLFFLFTSSDGTVDAGRSSAGADSAGNELDPAPLAEPHLKGDPSRRVDEKGDAPKIAAEPVITARALLHGVVLDRDSGQPVDQAKVVALRADGGTLTGTTGANGRFEFGALEENEPIAVRVDAIGYAAPRETPRSQAHAEGGVDLVIRIAKAIVLRGRLLDEDGRGVIARLELRRGARRSSLQSDADGSFLVNDVAGRLGFTANPPETIGQLWVRSDDHLEAFRALRRSELESGAALEIRLAKGSCIAGRCVAVGDLPLEHVDVLCYPTQGSRFAALRSARTDARGGFRFGGLESGVYRVEPAAAVKDLVPNKRSIEVEVQATGEATGVEFIFAPGFPIAGRVVDRKDESPVPDRIVTLHHEDWIEPRIAICDENGQFGFGALTEGKYQVVLRGISLRDRAEPQSIEVSAGVTDVLFKVDEPPRDGTLVLKIYEAASGKPLAAGTEVVLRGFAFDGADRRDRFAESLVCGADGAAKLSRLKRLRYEAIASTAEFAPARVAFAIERENQQIDLDLPLAAGVAVSGRVVDPSGKPLEGARVASFRKDDADVTLTEDDGVLCDAEGGFVLAHAPIDAAWICARAPGLAPARVALEAGAHDVHGLTIRLAHGATISGFARHANGSPARRFLLELQGAVAVQTLTTDDAGLFEFEDVEPGPFTLRDGDGVTLYEDTIGDEGLEIEVEAPD